MLKLRKFFNVKVVPNIHEALDGLVLLLDDDENVDAVVIENMTLVVVVHKMSPDYPATFDDFPVFIRPVGKTARLRLVV